MSDQGIFLDILARLNLASVERVLKDVNTAMREGGRSSSRSFSEGFSLNGAKAQFGELAKASETAYRDMERGLQNLQIQESRINEMRANSYRHTSQAMIAAQREFDAALANSLRLMEAADARKASIAASRAVVAPASRGREEEPRGRGSVIPIPRAANVAGAGAALGLAGLGYEASRVAVDVQGSLNRVQAQQRDTSDNIRLLTQSVWQIAQQSGIKPKQIAGAYGNVERATNYVTGQGYRGQEAVDVMQNAAMLTRTAPGTSLDEAIQAITTTSHDYRIKVQEAAALLSAGAAGVKGSMDDFASSLHSIEPAAQMAGIQPTEIIAALQQMSQTGQTSQQSAPNLSNLLANLARPNAAQAKRMSQLNINPQDISTHLSSRGLAGTLQDILQQVAKSQGPDGLVNLGYAYQNQLEEQQQQEDFEHLSPDVQRLVGTPAFQKSEIGGFQVRSLVRDPKKLKEIFGQSNINLDDTDLPIVQDWLKKQSELHGPNSSIKSDSPQVQNLLGAYQGIFGGKEAARSAMMIAGSPAVLEQFKGREAELGKEGTPDAFTASFKQAMSSDEAKFQKLGASAEALAGKLGEHLLPILGRVADDLNGFIDFLDRNKVAMDAFIVAIGGLAAAWTGAKVINMFSDLATAFGPLKSGATIIGELLSSRLPTQFGAAGTAATELATAETVAAGKVGTAGTEIALAGTEAGAAGLGGAMRTAAGNVLKVFNIAALTAMLTQAFDEFTDPSHGSGKAMHDWIQNHGLLPGEKPGGKPGEGQPDLGHVVQPPSPGQRTPTDKIKSFFGFAGGTGNVHDPFSQPLLGQRDTGGDSILGMLGGKPVGLRGGEGILTPEAVHAIGGKDAIDGLNNNPWSNPLKVATTFYGSFADGVAKYSPWGKYLKASSQTLDSLTQEFDQSTKAHEAGGGMSRGQEGGMLQAMIAQMTPEQRASMGITTGPRGGLMLPGGQRVSSLGHAAEGVSGGKGTAQYIYQAALAKGYSPSDATAIVAYAIGESGLNPKISGGRQGDDEVIGLFQEKSGFARSGGVDPSQRGTMEGNVTAYLNNLEGHRGQGDIYNQLLRTSVGGPMYTGGRGYMNQLYSQAQAVLGGDSGNKWWGKSRGGVVGFADGGVTPGSPGPGGGGNNRDSPGATMHPNIPDWWHGGSNYGDLDPWWISAQWGDRGPDIGWGTGPGGHYGSGGSPGLPMYPSHSPGKNGIGGFSTGGIVGFDPGGVVPPPGPIPGPAPFPGMPRTNDDIAPPDQGSVGTPSGAARLGTGASSKPTVPKDDRLAQTKPVETPPGNSPPGSLVPQGTQPGMAPTPSGDRNINQNPSHNVAEGNTGKGFGLGGGLVGSLEGAAQSAISAAGLAADASGADGGGSAGAAAANQALQIGFQLANRAIGYGGQLAGIGLEGLSETFLPHDSEKSVPTKNLFGKIALGIAGAHPSGSNVAGDSAQQLKPKDDLDAGSQQSQGVTPMVHMENTTINHNGPGDVHNEMQRGINAALFGAGQLGG